jgi:toxin ParE1/3/4
MGCLAALFAPRSREPLHWLNDRNPRAAAQVGEDVLTSVEQFETFPLSGREGRRAHTREMVIVGRPYVVIYRILDADVVILRVLHGAELWPPSGD